MDLADRRVAGPGPGTPRVLCQVYNAGAIPTAVPAYFACHTCTLSGAEVEGGAASAPATSDAMLVYCVGPGVPVAGDYLIAALEGGRWVAQRGKPSIPTFQGVKIGTCPCIMPGILHVTIDGGTSDSVQYPDTLTYQAKPVPDNGTGFDSTLTWYGAKVSVQSGATIHVHQQDLTIWGWTYSFVSGDQFNPLNWAGDRGGVAAFADYTIVIGDLLTFYELICLGGGTNYQLYQSTYQADGTAVSQAAIQRWTPGTTGNTCGPPVAFHNGQGLSGFPGTMNIDP